MPRKQMTFAEKVKKEKHVVYCPQCGGPKQPVLYVASVKDDSGSWKFRGKNVSICKCNQDKFYK